jgi:hypothetical protein
VINATQVNPAFLASVPTLYRRSLVRVSKAAEPGMRQYL